MNTKNKEILTIEHHVLALKYAHIRLTKHKAIDALVESIDRHGQIVPVTIVRDTFDTRWVLIDGYLRVNALARLGKDTIDAQIWHYDEQKALIMMLLNNQTRGWEALEEALLLRELSDKYALSQNTIAQRIGRDKSWVSRRLSLLEGLSETILKALLSGTCSHWVAVRILAPLARANTQHAAQLLEHLAKNHYSTRELNRFYEHYTRSNEYSQAS